jgi:class 3 adenylate cyclase/tetratricopeptide (TPR) repeat protein
MRCPQCQEANPPGARFCSACGVGLPAVCPACGHGNAPGSRFCNECGQALSPGAPAPPSRATQSPESYTPRYLAERILTSRSALEGERKQVTVLFADVRGSLELLADRDPEEARRLLDPVLERMMEAVHHYEGTVNQVLGDGIMALFGAPLAHEDHAVRACYAALRMQEHLTRYSHETLRAHGVPVQIRVGLNSGDVVVRSIGSDLRMDYTAVGQTTHLAARMEQMARPGSVFLAADTLKLAEGYVRTTPIGPVPVRGLLHPIEVFELVGATTIRLRLQARGAYGFTRFVGREPELDQLRRALARAGEGHGQVVAVAGEVGVGKSRLVWEFAQAQRARGWLVLESSSASYGTATPFLPVVELLKAYFQLDERDATQTVREKVARRVVALDETLEPTLPVFLALLDVPVESREPREDPAQVRQRSLNAVKRLLLRQSQAQPVLLVCEDLQWIDPDTQALLDSLIESLAAARLLLVVSYRTEYRHGWSGRSHYAQLRLDPLPPQTAGALLHDLMGTDPGLEPLKRHLIELTQGNPFFLEESVRSLAETGALVGDRGAYRLAKAFQTIQVPATVRAVLGARVDRLPAEDKRLLQTAAVIGRDVPLSLLSAIADVPEEDLRAGLARIQAAEFLYEARLFPDVEYAFTHGLMLEVAYGSLLHERRRQLHARIVEALERLHPDRLRELAPRLAHHAFRAEAWNKALTYFRQTGEEASPISLDAPLTGGPESAGYLWWTGNHERAVSVGQRDLAIAADFRNFPMTVVTRFRLGQTCHSLGDYPRAIDYLRRNVAALDGDLVRERFGAAGLPSVLSHVWLAWSLGERGEFAEAVAFAEEGVAIGEAAEHPYSLILATGGLGTVCLLKGDLDAGILALERSLVLSRVERMPLLFPFIAGPLGAAYARRGRITEGLPLLEQAVEQAASMTLMANQPLRVAWLAETHLIGGRSDRASDLAAQALALALRQKERGHEAYALRLRAELAARREPPDLKAAGAAYREALGLAETLGMAPLRARCQAGLGQLRGT